MERLDSVAKEAYFLADFVSLNMFMLDCRRVNRVLINMVREVQQVVTNYYKAKNQKENRRFVLEIFFKGIHSFIFSYRICDEFEEMATKAGERPKETAEVVALQNYLNTCREEKVFNLKADIREAAYRILFLLQNATFDSEWHQCLIYTVLFNRIFDFLIYTHFNLSRFLFVPFVLAAHTDDEIYLNSRTFLWPNELEQVLELSSHRLNVIRENLEVALRYKYK